MNEKEIMIQGMNKFIFFNFNFSEYKEMIKYIVDSDNEDGWMFKHFDSKWSALYESVGARAVMPTFYCELDSEYRRRMLEYIINNYNTEQKI